MSEMTVEELAALCGLTRDSQGDWTGKQPWAINPCVISYHNTWAAFGVKGRSLVEDAPEHAALLALAKHLKLTPKEPDMTRYTRIDKTPGTDRYDTYKAMGGDVWVFHGGQRWTVQSDGYAVGPESSPRACAPRGEILGLTSHIERPVKTVTVPKEGYVPQVGDRFCGPEGVVMTVTWFDRGLTYFGSGTCGRDMSEIARYVALCSRIERDQ